MDKFAYNPKEEFASALTHGIGFLLSIPAFISLVIFACSKNQLVYLISFVVYGMTLTTLYLCSTLFHSCRPCKTRRLFRILDHVAIYLLIAGTYTPFLLITVQGRLGWTLFVVIWLIAIVGAIYKAFFLEKWRGFSTLVYVIMGWLVLVAHKPLYCGLTKTGFWLLVAGGIVFTIGAVLYSFPKIPYTHTVWHIFVMGGTAFMYFCILFYV